MKGDITMNEEAVKIITDTKKSLIEKYSLNKKITTKNNVIYSNDEVVLIQNMTTGELKFKQNLR